MKVEMDIKELAALVDFIRKRRDFFGSVDDLANDLVKRVPQKVTEQFSHRI